MKDKTPIPDHVLFTEGSYSWFHFKMIGMNFMHNGNLMTKLEVYNEHRRDPGMLRLIIAGKTDYVAVDKPGWKKGILQDKRSYSRNELGVLVLG